LFIIYILSIIFINQIVGFVIPNNYCFGCENILLGANYFEEYLQCFLKRAY